MITIQPEIHVGDIGTVFEATLVDQNGAAYDVSSATTQQLWFLRPDGTVVTQTSVFTTNGKDGKIRYVTIAADLAQVGNWKVQAYVVLSSGTWHSTVKPFLVHANLQ